MATLGLTGSTRSARTVRALAALLVATLALAVAPLTGASAEPPVSPAQARRELARLEREADAAVEDYNAARLDLTRAQRRAATVQARVRRAEARLAAQRARMGSFISAAYQSGGVDSFVTLMTTSNPQTFLDQATTLDQIARDQAGQLRALRSAAVQLKTQQEAARAALAETRAIERRLNAVRRDIEAKAARQERLLEIVEGRARAARAAAYASRPRASRSVSRIAYTGAAEGRARIAVAEAYKQLGKPYRWGASGPDSFDCSGLTMWVWGKAGVALPHSSRAQYGYGRHVSKSELRPGDLVFYGSPIHHVGIYVGNGQYIAAPHTGDVVGFRSVNRGDWAGATRL